MDHAGRDAKRGALYTMLAAGATCLARSGSETPRQHARLRIAALKAYGASVSALRRKGLRVSGAARLGYLTETTASASNASHALAEWEEKDARDRAFHWRKAGIRHLRPQRPRSHSAH